MRENHKCPETYDGRHSLEDIDGKCMYCKKRIELPTPKPRITYIPELIESYGMYYDPDWGREDWRGSSY